MVNHPPERPGKSASVKPAISMRESLMYVQIISPIAAVNSPIIGMIIQILAIEFRTGRKATTNIIFTLFTFTLTRTLTFVSDADHSSCPKVKSAVPVKRSAAQFSSLASTRRASELRPPPSCSSRWAFATKHDKPHQCNWDSRGRPCRDRDFVWQDPIRRSELCRARASAQRWCCFWCCGVLISSQFHSMVASA